MEDTAKLSFKVKRQDDKKDFPLFLEVRLDGEVKYKKEAPFEEELVEIFVSDEEAEHTLELEMSGKTYAHTVLDANNEISSDTMIEVYDFELEDIDIGFQVTQSTYRHSFNSPDPNAETEIGPFCNAMGCNGVVTFKFTTPAFIWLLENV